MSNKVRVRFAPSPTGGLHLGGVRTVLYNYLFARKHGGDFILRIEDTDQNRFVEGAEQYIFECLDWCGLVPDESPVHGGNYGPYRQSERKALYQTYVEQLVKEGFAYYAFDTPEELDKMRNENKSPENPSPQYDHKVRMQMRNSLALTAEEVDTLIKDNIPHVVRIKMPKGETIAFTDLIHGHVSFESELVDDKVLLKADGMPTYHLAVVVDDYLMKITHAFRGEEWLSSAPVHILLWKYLFGLDKMPQWAHLPLILGPNGKLSKRDGAKYGFPVYAMNWTDPATNELTEGFKEKGFLPQAFINLLAVLGWNNGTEQECFSLEEMIKEFTIDRVHKSGAKFDFEKAKWFNHEWIKQLSVEQLLPLVKQTLANKALPLADETYLAGVIALVKDRCTLLPDFYEQSAYFFIAPEQLDETAVKGKWDTQKSDFFEIYCDRLSACTEWTNSNIESEFRTLATEKNIKPGELQLPMRIMLVGGKYGPAVFEIAAMIGQEETIARIKKALTIFNRLNMKRPIRVLVAKVGLDGHDRGAKVIATALRDAGMEVIYTGLRQTPEMVVNAALQEDVDAIGVSILSGAHMTVFPKIMELLKQKQMNDVLLTGGGIIPEDDMDALNKMGVGQLFPPGTTTQTIADYIRTWVSANRSF